MKSLIYLFFVLLFVSLLISCSKKEAENTDISPNKQDEITITTDVSWLISYDNFEAMIESSDLIIVGKLVAHSPEKRHDIIFTKEQIETIKVIKGDINEKDRVDILLTGGTLGEEATPTIEGIPLFDENIIYILFLEGKPEGHYLIAGGYQGCAQLDNDTFTLDNKNYKIDELERYMDK